MLGYLLSRQDQPGRFGEGCGEKRHAIGLCHHQLRGFFSVGSRDDTVAPMTLPTGVVVNDEWEARFAASCFALRVVLQAGLDRREAVRHHLESLLALSERWERQEFDASRDLLFFALGAVAMAPLEYRDRIRTLCEHVLEEQTDAGLWPGTSLFHAIETLLLLPTKAGVEAVRRSLPAVIREQRPSGAFDDTDNEEMALIALRALRAHGVPRVSPRPPRFNRTVIRQ